MMKKLLARLHWAGFLVLISVISAQGFAAEYIFRDLMANTLSPVKCAAKSDASASAADTYTVKKFTKTFCETQGYGWHVSETKDTGKLVCNECSADGNSEGKFQCHLEDVVVTCKRLKPGSVGMFPGKG